MKRLLIPLLAALALPVYAADEYQGDKGMEFMQKYPEIRETFMRSINLYKKRKQGSFKTDPEKACVSLKTWIEYERQFEIWRSAAADNLLKLGDESSDIDWTIKENKETSQISQAFNLAYAESLSERNDRMAYVLKFSGNSSALQQREILFGGKLNQYTRLNKPILRVDDKDYVDTVIAFDPSNKKAKTFCKKFDIDWD